MKLHNHHLPSLILPLIAAVILGGCVESGYSGGPYHSGGSGLHASFPGSQAGGFYHYNGQSYSGGRYESGRYHDHGRSYTNRYYHNGRYLYGGTYQQHGASRNGQDHHRESNQDRGRNYGHDRSGR
jgi:hypothetical protein